MSDNWVVQNLEKALNVWNDKLSEIWQLITQSPTNFKGGTLWNVVSSIHGALQAIGYALLVLFFVIGVMKTCGSLTDVKRHGLDAGATGHCAGCDLHHYAGGGLWPATVRGTAI